MAESDANIVAAQAGQAGQADQSAPVASARSATPSAQPAQSQPTTPAQPGKPTTGGLMGDFLVTDSQRAELLRLPLAAHKLQFNEAEFRELLADSVSLSFAEKKKTLTVLGKLVQAQMDELLTILREERERLKALDQEQQGRLRDIDTAGKDEQEALARELAEKLQKEKDSTEVQRIREELFGSGE